MFCVQCGTQLPDEAKFCTACGNPIQSGVEAYSNNAGTQLVKACCTNCNAALEVDSSKEAAICPYCNTPYIVEKAINNYNYNINMNAGEMKISNAVINVTNGISAENLLKRAEKYEEDGDLKMALEYYNKVLDMDVTQKGAEEAIRRVNHKIQDYVYYTVPANMLFTFGTLLLKKDRLVFLTKKGRETDYFLNRINNPKVSMGSVSFEYEGKKSEIVFSTKQPKMLLEQLLNIKNGIYPQMISMSKKNEDINNTIISNYSRGSRLEAIRYYQKMTGAGLQEANYYIDKLFKENGIL